MHADKSEPSGIYIHIPFCLKKCPYCGFYSITELSLKEAFLKALIREMRILGNIPFIFDTIYIGGGTPSVLTPYDIGKIIENACRFFRISQHAEITMEVNPGTVDQKSFKGFNSAGVNRISIGAQSFQEANLKFLGRIHSVKDISLAVKWARKADFDNIGLDLIYGLPGQTKKSFILDLKNAVDFKPEHLSCYMLTYEPGTPMHKALHKTEFHFLPDKSVTSMFKTASEFLSMNKYVHYEISNFGLIGSDGHANVSRHNMKYWTSVPYIGLGPSAHSFIEPVRCWNACSVLKYIEDLRKDRLSMEGKEVLSSEQQIIEAISLGLRLKEGIKTDSFDDKFKVNFKQKFAEKIAYLEKDGFINISKNRCSLTQKGMLFADSITAMLI